MATIRQRQFGWVEGRSARVLYGEPAALVWHLSRALVTVKQQPVEPLGVRPVLVEVSGRAPVDAGHWLEQRRLTALETRLKANLVLGRHAELIGELESLVIEHRLHEGLHRLLMLSLYRSGRQAEALEVYRRARHILSEELSIDPGRALQELEGAILTQDPSLDWTPSAVDPRPRVSVEAPLAPAAVTRQQVWNVPARNPHFTGREDMLTELHRRLHAEQPTLVVQALYGLGGVGKTRDCPDFS